MVYPLYNLLLNAAAPFVRRRLASNSTEAPLLARFDPPQYAATGSIWIQACSVGEVNTAAPLVAALRAALPDIPLLVTASTLTGHDRATALFGEAHSAWFPFDTLAAVRAFFDTVQPRVLVLIETELWPNVIAEAGRRKVPVVIVNGRISEKHFARYRRLRPLLATMLRGITHAGMQSTNHAARLKELGVPASALSVTGNLKYDAAPLDHDAVAARRLRTEYGFAPNDPVLVFGSTHPREEALASACWTVLREDYPRLRLIVAPRHLDRLKDARAPFGREAALRSELKRKRPAEPPRVIFVDSFGELIAAHARSMSLTSMAAPLTCWLRLMASVWASMAVRSMSSSASG